MVMENREAQAAGAGPSGARHEVRLALRAGSSSVISTIVDGVVYEMVLLGSGPGSRRYILAALIGATFGALTNFGLNRYWSFRATHTPISRQAMHYAGAAAMTNLALQAVLVSLVEFLHVDPRLAWVPAKVIVWLIVSYPLARFVVFRPPALQEDEVDASPAPHLTVRS